MKLSSRGFMKNEIADLSPDEAIEWCNVFGIDWESFDPNDVEGPLTWVKALQIRANDQT